MKTQISKRRIWLWGCGMILLVACEKQPVQIDPVAALYSDTQVIPNIEFSNIDSISLKLDVYVQTKRLGEPPWVEYSDDRKPTLLFLHGRARFVGLRIVPRLQYFRAAPTYLPILTVCSRMFLYSFNVLRSLRCGHRPGPRPALR